MDIQHLPDELIDEIKDFTVPTITRSSLQYLFIELFKVKLSFQKYSFLYISITDDSIKFSFEDDIFIIEINYIKPLGKKESKADNKNEFVDILTFSDEHRDNRKKVNMAKMRNRKLLKEGAIEIKIIFQYLCHQCYYFLYLTNSNKKSFQNEYRNMIDKMRTHLALNQSEINAEEERINNEIDEMSVSDEENVENREDENKEEYDDEKPEYDEGLSHYIDKCETLLKHLNDFYLC